jgi:hypothetical protein
MYHNNPVTYEVLELEKQPECIDASVMCLFELEKTEMEKQARAANERLKVRLDKLAEFARSKVKSSYNIDECGTARNCPVCGKTADLQESIDIEA